MKIVSTRGWMLLAVILIYSFIPSFGGLLRVIELSGGPGFIPENPRALSAQLPIVIHIIASFVFCIVGAFQFMPGIRRHVPILHRINGAAVAVAGMVSAASGLWMTVYFVFPQELQGPLLFWVRILVSVLMMALIFWSVAAILQRNILVHGALMLRAYAIGQGASTQAFLGIAWIAIYGADPTGLSRNILMVSAWVLNLLVAEFLIAKIFVRRHEMAWQGD